MYAFRSEERTRLKEVFRISNLLEIKVFYHGYFLNYIYIRFLSKQSLSKRAILMNSIRKVFLTLYFLEDDSHPS